MNKKLGREPMLNPVLSTSQVFNTRELKMMKSEVAQKTWAAARIETQPPQWGLSPAPSQDHKVLLQSEPRGSLSQGTASQS